MCVNARTVATRLPHSACNGHDAAGPFRSAQGKGQVYAGLPGADVATVIVRLGQPFYVNRYTGEIVLGPARTGASG